MKALKSAMLGATAIPLGLVPLAVRYLPVMDLISPEWLALNSPVVVKYRNAWG